ncbi:hypothetical protein CVT26_013560 [Gymnopilus dilepis]|uniref:F-box domain-containing protein n=1 Tax=Gymnopilus dilepis TaxID=231916 RepID=A0A409YWY0_9AGAR|nr:hypothetical protein CVT26_013560 [Gymnopilus dilepis]
MVHGALLVPQVLRLIFQNLGPFFTPSLPELFESTNLKSYEILPKFSHSRMSLLSAALTCKSFMDPALDVLWWVMDDLEPLFQVVLRMVQIRVIHQPIAKSEIQAFVTYANRVKLFILRGSSTIHPSSYIQVLQAIERMSIFPSLNYLLSLGSFPELHLLATNCLIGFYGYSVRNPVGEPVPIDMWTFVRGLPASTNKLKFLELEYPVTKSCLDAISQLPELQTIFIDDSNESSSALGSAFFRSLSVRSKAAKLNLVTKGALGNTVIAPNLAFACDFLTDLTFLCVEDGPASTHAPVGLQAIFRVIKLPRLHTLRISYPAVDESDLAVWKLFFKSLVTATPMLLALSLRAPFRLRSTTATTPKGVSLHQISRLSKHPLVFLEDDNFFNLWSLDDCNFVVESWPSLTALTIGTIITFHMLTVLVSGLPNLYELKIALSSKRLPDVEELPVVSHSPTVITLRPTFTAPDDPIHIATCLDKLCPFAEIWIVPQSARLDPRGAWKQTGRILQALRSARLDGRERRPMSLKQLQIVYSKYTQTDF